MRLDLSYTWIDPGSGMRGTSHRETFADLRLAVLKRVFTLNRSIEADAELEEPREAVRVSLFPLAEFIAFNWWALLYEPRKHPLDSSTYNNRHRIDRHRDGFAYPRVEIYGSDSNVQLAAYPSKVISAGVEFPTGLPTTEPINLERHATEETLLRLVQDVLQRVTDVDDKSMLHEAIEAINQSRSDPDEHEYCVLAGLLGGDPYEPDDRLEKAIRTVCDKLGKALSKEIFATSELESVVGHAESIRKFAHESLMKSKSAAEHVAGLKGDFGRRLAKSAAAQPAAPWKRGYQAAQELRGLLSIDTRNPLPDDKALQQKLLDGAQVESIEGFDWQRLSARGLGADDRNGFGIAIDPKGQINPRFQLVSTFADYLLSDETDLFLSTTGSTDRQKRNRAFAAEFLAPIDAIRARLGHRETIVSRELNAFCKEFGVSGTIVKYQIENQAPDLAVVG